MWYTLPRGPTTPVALLMFSLLAGAYTEMPADPLVPASSSPDPIPSSGLVNPNGVLGQRLVEIRNDRAQHRAKVLPRPRTTSPALPVPSQMPSQHLAHDLLAPRSRPWRLVLEDSACR
jgi:hypothetical protein